VQQILIMAMQPAAAAALHFLLVQPPVSRCRPHSWSILETMIGTGFRPPHIHSLKESDSIIFTHT
jgi:hypothetical protein